MFRLYNGLGHKVGEDIKLARPLQLMFTTQIAGEPSHIPSREYAQ
jgi:hypothetical protein